MENLYLPLPAKSAIQKSKLFFKVFIALLFLNALSAVTPASAQVVLFDFDNVAAYTPFPITVTVGSITAHLSGTGQGYSIQAANVHGFTPTGFSGNVIDPSSINLADLLISFNQKLTDFSIMYACQELACDDAATMRVTAYLNGNYVGTNTKMTSHPGTWPSDTLSCSFAQGFDSVVVHYDHRPPTCQDYGVIFMADNMWVTAYTTSISQPKPIVESLIIPNPVSQSAVITFSLLQSENIHLTIYDIAGRLIKILFDGHLNAGEHQINWDINGEAITSGIYLLNLNGENLSSSRKIVVVK